MFKEELEQRLGFELCQEGWKQLQEMYMACDLSKDDFAALVKSGAKKLYALERKEDTTFKGVLIHWNDCIGMWEIKDINIVLFMGSFFPSLERAKSIIKMFK